MILPELPIPAYPFLNELVLIQIHVPVFMFATICMIQILCLMGLWAFKQNPSTAIFFPSAIGLLMVIRAVVLPKIFNEEELVELGDPTPQLHLDDGVI